VDLTEAIHYFQAGVDDIPVSSAQSILSGRSFGSFGSRKITLRVDITVDYDGPSLSGTSSLVSLEEYRNRNGSESSLSFESSVHIEPEDDSVTVSSRDTGIIVGNGDLKPSASGGSSGKGLSTVVAEQQSNLGTYSVLSDPRWRDCSHRICTYEKVPYQRCQVHQVRILSSHLCPIGSPRLWRRN